MKNHTFYDGQQVSMLSRSFRQKYYEKIDDLNTCNITNDNSYLCQRQNTKCTYQRKRNIHEQSNLNEMSETANKFSPQQDLNVILQKLYAKLKQVLDKLDKKYQIQGTKCLHQFYFIKQLINHYKKQGHFNPYFAQLHEKSTNTKINLLKMLTNEQETNKQLEQQSSRLLHELNCAKQLVKNKTGECQAYFDQLTKLKSKIQQQARQNQNLIQKVNQLRTINKQLKGGMAKIQQKLEKNQAKIGSFKAIQNRDPSINNTSKISNQKSCKKINFKQNKSNSLQAIGEQELYRFLFIQATTIEQQCISGYENQSTST